MGVDQDDPLHFLTPVAIPCRQVKVRLHNINCLQEGTTNLTKESNDCVLLFV